MKLKPFARMSTAYNQMEAIEMLVLAIPEDLEESFHTEYAAWCATNGVANALAGNQVGRDYVVHGLSKTTNVSNPMKQWIVVATFADMKSPIGKFLDASPKWLQTFWARKSPPKRA